MDVRNEIVARLDKLTPEAQQQVLLCGFFDRAAAEGRERDRIALLRGFSRRRFGP